MFSPRKILNIVGRGALGMPCCPHHTCRQYKPNECQTSDLCTARVTGDGRPYICI